MKHFLLATFMALVAGASIFVWAIAKWNYPLVISQMSPWLTLFGPLLAAALVYFGWNRSHTDSSTRDMQNWRRTTVANNLSSMQSSSTKLHTIMVARGSLDFTAAEENTITILTSVNLIRRLQSDLSSCCDAVTTEAEKVRMDLWVLDLNNHNTTRDRGEEQHDQWMDRLTSNVSRMQHDISRLQNLFADSVRAN